VIKRLVLAGAVAIFCAACSGNSGLTAADTKAGEAGTSGSVSASEPTTSSPATSAEISAAAPCTEADILLVLRRRIGHQVVRTKVVRCQNDYARVNAVPDSSRCPPTCYQQYEAYVRWTGEDWRVVDFGTGIGCEDTTSLPPLPTRIRRACRALGYPQPTVLRTPSFQMPSRNIGCAWSDAAIRCDILSGLKPEPAKQCELDWVGLVLSSEGPPEPNCAGDTVYDRGSPMLAYGDLWHQARLWCESQRSGLLCFNTASNGSFHLSRESWEGGAG
jgi:hypothetical protein